MKTQFIELTEEQREFQLQAREFVEREIRPHSRKWDESETCPLEIMEKLGSLDYLRAGFPESDGGLGGTVEQMLLIEELAAGSAGVALVVYVHTTLACAAVAALGSKEQKKHYLKPGLEGVNLGCWAYAEANAGADVSAVELSAVADGNDFVLNGSKLYITNGPVADFVVLVARTAKSPGLSGISLFIVERGTPGFNANPMKKLGTRSSTMAELVFNECRVSGLQLLGELHTGFRSVIRLLSRGRALAAAFAVGLGSEALRQTVEHVKVRRQGAVFLSGHQGVRFILADMNTRLEAARTMAYCAGRLIDQERPFDTECAMAKLYASETATWICERALHLHGAQGYMMESDIQRFYRDCKVLELGEGTSEIQREMIAAAFL